MSKLSLHPPYIADVHQFVAHLGNVLRDITALLERGDSTGSDAALSLAQAYVLCVEYGPESPQFRHFLRTERCAAVWQEIHAENPSQLGANDCAHEL